MRGKTLREHCATLRATIVDKSHHYFGDIQRWRAGQLEAVCSVKPPAPSEPVDTPPRVSEWRDPNVYERGEL